MTDLPPRNFWDKHGEFCKTFANGNRLKILDVLRDGECTVTTLTETTDIPQPTVSQHLKVLRDQDVVSRRKDGVKGYYSVKDERVYSAIDEMRSMTKERLSEERLGE